MFTFSVDKEIRLDVDEIIELLEESRFNFDSNKYSEIKTVYKILKDVCEVIENRFPEFKDADKDADKSCSRGCEHKCNHECKYKKLEAEYEELESAYCELKNECNDLEVENSTLKAEIKALKNKIRKQKRLIRKLYRELNNNTTTVEIEIYFK